MNTRNYSFVLLFVVWLSNQKEEHFQPNLYTTKGLEEIKDIFDGLEERFGPAIDELHNYNPFTLQSNNCLDFAFKFVDRIVGVPNDHRSFVDHNDGVPIDQFPNCFRELNRYYYGWKNPRNLLWWFRSADQNFTSFANFYPISSLIYISSWWGTFKSQIQTIAILKISPNKLF